MTISEEQIKSAGDLIDKIISQEEELKAAFSTAYQGEYIVGEMVKELKLLRADSTNAEENYKRLEKFDMLRTALYINTVVKAELVELARVSPLMAFLLGVSDDEKQ